jgi:Dockerin type I domain
MRRFAAVSLFALSFVAILSGSARSESDPPHSTLANFYGGHYFISLEGSTNGSPDLCVDGRCGDYAITVRDAANNPVQGSVVTIDFSGCSDITLSCDQLESVTGQQMTGPHQLTLLSNAAGQVTFRVQGASNAVLVPGNVTSPGVDVATPCAQAYADGVLLGSLVVSAYDVNGAGSPSAAVNATDAAIVLAEGNKSAIGAQPRARDDVNFSGTVNATDASIYMMMANQAALGTGSANTGPYCP